MITGPGRAPIPMLMRKSVPALAVFARPAKPLTAAKTDTTMNLVFMILSGFAPSDESRTAFIHFYSPQTQITSNPLIPSA